MGQTLVAQYLSVFISPKGRLSRELYWFYVIPVLVAVGTIWFYLRLGDGQDDEPALSTIWLYPLLTLYWMQACIMCRRLHDMGYPGSPAFAIAFVLSIYGIVEFYPSLLGDSDEMAVKSYQVLGYFYVAAKWTFRLMGAGAMIAPGEDGPNPYGEPLGTLSPQAKARKEAERWDRLRAEFSQPRAKVVPNGDAVVSQIRTVGSSGDTSQGIGRTSSRSDGVRGNAQPPRAVRGSGFGRR